MNGSKVILPIRRRHATEGHDEEYYNFERKLKLAELEEQELVEEEVTEEMEVDNERVS